MKRSLLVPVFIVVLLVGILIGLGIGYQYGFNIGHEAGRKGALAVVRMGHLSADLHQLPFFLAYQKGWYEGEGIAILRKEYLYGMPQMMAFVAGELDAGYVGVVPAIIARSQGADLVVLASSNLEGSAIVAKPEVKSVKDLDGKTVGTPGLGSIQDTMIRMVAKKLGININIRHHKFSDLPMLLEKGEIDAYIDWEPFCAEAVVKGVGHVIYTSHDILPNHQCCVLYVSGKMFRESPELVRKLVLIHVKALREIKEGPPEEVMKIFSDVSGKPMDLLKEAWKRMTWGYHVNIESVKVFVKSLIEDGKVDPKAVPDIDKFVEALVNQRILDEVLKEHVIVGD